MKLYEYHDVNLRGTIEKVCYCTTNLDGQPREKYALVYLPKDYDGNDTQTRYNILYLMHGGGGNPDAWLDCCKIKNMLDYAIDSGEVEPLIVVFPTFYKERIARIGKTDPIAEQRNTRFFQQELVQDLLPAVEGKYHTFARCVTREGLQASRRHRAFGGFSMGGCTTWFALMDNLDVISAFLPLSGDCWAVEPLGGGSRTEETAQVICDAIKVSGYGMEDYQVYAATGSEDLADTALTPLVEALKRRNDCFLFSEDFSRGNLHYFVEQGMKHQYEAVFQYLYNYLPYLFRK